jgi:hypothetical protein
VEASRLQIEIVYLKLQSTRLALSRIAARVRQGGHDVPRLDVIPLLRVAGLTQAKFAAASTLPVPW